EYVKSYLEQCIKSTRSSKTQHAAGNIHDTLWRTLLADRDAWGGLLEKDSTNAIRESYHRLLNDPGSRSSARFNGLAKQENLAMAPLGEDVFTSTVFSLSEGQNLTFALTKQGLMGLLPKSSRDEDWIVVLNDCAVPLVL